MIDVNVIQTLNLLSVLSVPIITLYIFRKERNERNRPILSLGESKNKYSIIDAKDNNPIKDIIDNSSIINSKAYMFNCAIAFNETENKLINFSKIIDLNITNIGIGIAYKIDLFYIKDNRKKEFTKLTFKLNNKYNYGINLKADYRIELSIDSINIDKKCHNFIVCYEDAYKNKYIDIIEITISTNNEKGSDNDKNIKYVYYNKEEYKNQEINTFKKETIKNNKIWINNLWK